MGETTKIEWCHHTLNPWIGCTKVSAGCAHCYAEESTPVRVMRAHGEETWGQGGVRHETLGWEADLRRWNREARAAGERRRVFCASLSDVFEDHPALPPLRARLFAAIEAAEALDVLLLTKRPQNMVAMAPESWAHGWPRHVWALASVEDQAAADKRIPELLRVPAAVRGLSMEPLLGPVDVSHYLPAWFCDACGHFMLGRGDDGAAVDEDEGSPCCSRCGSLRVRAEGIHWIIIGGESGRKARTHHLEDARRIIRQADAAGVPPFYKQMGGAPVGAGAPVQLRTRKGGDLSEIPADLARRAFPISAALSDATRQRIAAGVRHYGLDVPGLPAVRVVP